MSGDARLIAKALTRITYIGLTMNVMAPATILIIAVLLFDRELAGGGGLHLQGRPTVQIYFYLFAAVAVLVFIGAYFIKTRMPDFALERTVSDPEDRFRKSAVRISLIVFLCNAMFAVFGLILLVAGGAIEVMMLFAALSMIGYQMLRPRQAYLERILAHVSPEIAPADDAD